MSYRGRGRSRGRGGYGRGGYGRGGYGRGGYGRGGYGRGHAKQEPFELFPEIEGFGTAEHSESKIQLIKWSMELHKFWITSSPYYYEDRRQRLKKAHKSDIERYSDTKSQTTKVKSQLEDVIMLDRDHIPAELAEGEKKRKRAAKKIRWNPELGQDIFEKFEKMDKGEGEETEKKENEDEEEENEENEEEEEFSDDGDYEQNEDFDDDEDDFNMVDDNDEAIY